MSEMIRHALLIALSLVVAACGDGEPDYAVGTVERHRINVVADSNEPIESLHAAEGDAVSTGALLARQNSEKLNFALDQARAEVAVASARLEEAETGPRAQEIAAARARVAAAESVYETLQTELRRQEALLSRELASQSVVDRLQGQFQEAEAKRDEARATLDELLEGTRSEELDQARATYAARRAELSRLEIDRERANLRAPVDGVVETIVFRVGERPNAGQTVVAVLSSERLFARVHIPEPLRTRIHIGDTATLHIDGHDGDYRGTVRWISSAAAFTPYYALTQQDRSRLAYLAEIDLTGDVDLPAGIPVEARFPQLEPQ